MGNPNLIRGPGEDLGPDADVSAPDRQQEETTTDPAAKSAEAQRIPKKRTKTGCLTCRQRRIKCGEEKPICNNCVKSKRECKGYAQRLVFMNPLGVSNPSNTQVAHTQLPPAPANLPLPSGYDAPVFSQQRPAGSHRPVLAPRPIPLPTLEQAHLPAATPSQYGEYQEADALPLYYHPIHGQGPSVSDSSTVQRAPIPAADYHKPPQELTTTFDGTYQQHPTGANIQNHSAQHHLRGSQSTSGWVASYGTNNPYDEYLRNHVAAPSAPEFSQIPGVASQLGFPHSGTSRPQQQPHSYQSASTPLSPSQYDDEGDDYYDVGSDEELEDPTTAENFNQLSLIMASANRDQRQLRSFTTYLNEPNLLASYHPTLGSSPLNNPKTARIFLHFIHSTGPTLSVFERHPVDPSTMFGAPVSPAQQGLWTYTLPFKALEHQALLQTILAVSSLHIAYLQQAPPTLSLRHYHFALKRVGVAVGLPTRRKQVGTLAAALLLAYYEVMNAEHYRWNSHIAGSAQLIREIDFAGLTRDLRAHRRRVKAQRKLRGPGLSFQQAYLFGSAANDDDPFCEKESSINEDLIGSFVGRAVNYDEFGQVEEGPGKSRQKHFTRKDIEAFRIQCDLYWWYCKQDMLQSLISGSGLFLPFSQWNQCPPRAGIGRLDAVYGSADHLWLLLGRLTDFGRRDRKRKLKATRATGTDWKPDAGLFNFMARFAAAPPGMQRGPPPNAPSGTPAAGAPPRAPPGSCESRAQPANITTARPGQHRGGSPESGGPPMYGMVPSSGPRHIPAAFADTAARPDHPTQGVEDDESGSYGEAESEWESILAAFDTFAKAIGPHFMPLPSDSAPPISTPFGPALQYRTQTIAVVWGFYYTGLMLLYRLHPCMPPAMMVAAGVAAPATAKYAQIVGQVAAGIYYPQILNSEVGRLSPTLGSCLIEMTVPLFFAGVQYMEAAHRQWIVTTLHKVSRLTGWKSSDAVANGCEHAWTMAAKQGRGPPYQRRDQSSYEPSPIWTHEQANDNPERRFVTLPEPVRSNWAMGILSLEDDLLNLEIADRM
ncbi:putative C6 finger domain protein [Aspergillus melleus]|uniref:putative C6 finger domain protein n=1 Tax=Aspergillus melleus TaxID=138277 RepID=UPI001E8D128C|nr:uncharacterized protein LDX57_002384 [Aspergillus melleus]KAH8424638.1 hypothetical protein LDX57_002384 [Aspergillus melleus]